MDYIPEGEKSGFDSRQLYVFELSQLRKTLGEARLQSDLHMRYTALIAYFSALQARMKKKRDVRKKHLEYYEAATKSYNEYIGAIRGKKRSVTSNLLYLFDKWEWELRYDEDELGLLTASRSDPGAAISGNK